MRWAQLQPIHDDMSADNVEDITAMTVERWQDITGSAAPPDEVDVLEEARIGEQWITDGTDSESSYHRTVRVAGEIVLHDKDRAAVEALGRAIDGLCEVLPVTREELVNAALGKLPADGEEPYTHAVVSAIAGLR